MNDVQPETVFAYDAVAYPTPVLPLPTPNRLAAAGLLHGWRAPDPSTASVLEIGCGEGFNLIGVAAVAPMSRCVGFDLSGEAIARGQALVAQTGLQNVELHRGDIMDYPRGGPQFDYIVCHGVYSWIPQSVRPALLELIRARLAPGGLAYLSFDTLPAASPKAAINAFLLRELAGIEGVEARVTGAVRLLTLLARNQRPESRLKGQLDQLLNDLRSFDPGYFYHDWLAEFYAPIALDAFEADVAANGLRRVGDAAMYDMFTGDLDDEARAMVEACGDDIPRRSTLLHMLRGSHVFRREMLVRADAPPPAVDWTDAVRTLSFVYLGTREELPEDDGRTATRYSDGPEGFVVAREPTLVVTMDALLKHSPNELTFDQLLAITGIENETLANLLRGIATLTVIDAHATAQNFVAEPGDHPRAGLLVRAMMANGSQAITLRHSKFVASHDATRVLLTLCDGTRDRDELVQIMSEQFDTPFDRAKIDGAIANFAAFRVFEA